MATRAETKALELSAKSKERYFLMFWAIEDKVSIHKENELKAQDSQDCLLVGDTASCRFGKTYYEGKIAGVGNRVDMLALEKDFIEGKYTPFEQQTEPTVTDTDERDISHNNTICPQSENGTPAPKPKRSKKRKLINKDFSNIDNATITDHNEDEETAANIDNTKNNTKANKKQKKLNSTTSASKKTIKKKEKPNDGNKRKKGIILVSGSGAETESDDDSSAEGDHNTIDVIEKSEQNCDEGVKERVCNEESINGENDTDESIEEYLRSRDEPWNDYVPPPDTFDSTTQTEGSMEVQHSMLKAIQDQFNYVSSALEDIQGQQTFMLRKLWNIECSLKHSPPGIHTTPWFGSNAEPIINQPLPYNLTPKSRSVTPMSLISTTATPMSSRSTTATPMSSRSTTATPMSSRSTTAIPMSSSMPTFTDITNTGRNVQTISPEKVVQDLPSIDSFKLISPEIVVEKYPKLVDKKKLTRLAVRLAQESFFGKEIMTLCTVKGNGDFHALPTEILSQLKSFMVSLSVPRFFTDRCSFEPTWKSCVESIGQSCKGLRN